MKTTLRALAVIFLLALVAALSFWMGQKNAPHGGTRTSIAAVASAVSNAPTKEKKLLYYRNPMGLPDTSPSPKKDPMGMDYVAVYEGGDSAEDTAGGGSASPNEVKLSTEKVQKIGVRSEAAQLRVLDKVVRAVGRIDVDERRIVAIAPKFEGFVEKLHVNALGQMVQRGQSLFEAYSPELVSAQREYRVAMQGLLALKNADASAQLGMQQLADASLLRLKNWDVSESQIAALKQSGESPHSVSFRSPVAGIVTEKKALQGMRFMPGEMLYQITDLSTVWVIADVFEQDIALVQKGALAVVKISAYPGRSFQGKVSFIYPILNSQTRTLPIRIELANPKGLLKPAMFAQVELPVVSKGNVVTIPHSAVIDSGVRQLVLLVRGEGRFAPREVRLGARSDQFVEVLEGLSEGDLVVTAANFLIDAESNLKAAIGQLGHAAHGKPTPAVSRPPVNSSASSGPKDHAGHGAQ